MQKNMHMASTLLIAFSVSCQLLCSVNPFHFGGLLCCTLNFLQGREVVVITKTLIIIINAQAELNHAVDAASELCGFIQVEPGGQQRGVEKQPDEVLDSLVRLVCCCLLLEFSHDAVLGIDFHGFLGDHVGSHGVITQGLGLHDPFHVGSPTIL